MLSFQPNKDDLFDSINKTYPLLRLRSNIHSYYIRTLLQGLLEENRLAKVEVFDPALGSSKLTPTGSETGWETTDTLSYLKHGCFEKIQKNSSPQTLKSIPWSLYWLRISEETLQEPQNLNMLSSLCERIRSYHSHVRILINYDAELPVALRPWCGTVELSIPRGTQLNDYVEEALKSLGALDGNETGELKAAVQGLDAGSIYEVLNEAVAESKEAGRDGLELLDAVRHRRDVRLRQFSGLEVLRSSVQTEDIGGLKYLIRYLEYQSRILSYRDRAKKEKVDLPKGILLVGLPGCGKSMAAMAAASIMKLPLLRLEIGALMGRFLGESEKNLRDAIRSAEGAAPCVLWVDELEKALGGMAGNSDNGGTGKRMLAMLLTWMQEQQQGVYIVATANAVEQLPPELLRRGRFDETFRVELPNEDERKDILRIHLKKRGVELSEGSLETAAKEITEGCNGADIEALIKEAKQRCWIQNKETLQLADLKAVRDGGFTPLSKQWKGKINDMLDQLKKQGFRNASVEPETPLPPPVPKLDEDNLPLPRELEQFLSLERKILLRIGNNPGWTLKLTQNQKKREAWIAHGLLQDVASEVAKVKGTLSRQKQTLLLRFSKDQKNFEPQSDLPNITRPIQFSKEDDGRVRIQFEDMCGVRQDLHPIIEFMKEEISFFDPELWSLLYEKKSIRFHDSDKRTYELHFTGEGPNRFAEIYKVEWNRKIPENEYLILASGDSLFLLPVLEENTNLAPGYRIWKDKNFRVAPLEESQASTLFQQASPILEAFQSKSDVERIRSVEFYFQTEEYLVELGEKIADNRYKATLYYEGYGHHISEMKRTTYCEVIIDIEANTWEVSGFEFFRDFHQIVFEFHRINMKSPTVYVDRREASRKGEART